MGWEQLTEIARQNREAQEREQDAPPDACPIDGFPLQSTPEGDRNCPLGNYRWDGVSIPTTANP